MSHSYFHALSSSRKFGGSPECYIKIHDWFDATKENYADARHRALRHHSQGIFECERQFGKTITNSDGKQIPVRLIGEQHVMEDCGGFIPTVADWLGAIQFQPWMNYGYKRSLAVMAGDREAPTPNSPLPFADNTSPDASTSLEAPSKQRVSKPIGVTIKF